jgi:hypothetical protein
MMSDTVQHRQNFSLPLITPTKALEDLESMFADYTALPLDMARKSDDIAIQKYGKTNFEIYNSLKGKLLDKVMDNDTSDDYSNTIISEAFVLPIGVSKRWTEDEMETQLDITTDKLLEKIQKAKDLQSDTMVIIYPFTKEYPYTLDDLNAMFTRYNSLSWDLQQYSDQESIALFGNDVRYMYEINKTRLVAMMDADPYEYDPDAIKDDDSEIDSYFDGSNDIQLESYFSAVSNMTFNDNTSIVSLLQKKLDMINISRSNNLLEATYADDGLEDIDTAIQLKSKNSIATPEFVPYLIPTEIDQLVGDGTGLSPNEKQFLEYYKKSIMEGMKNFDSKEYFKSIKSLYEERLQNPDQAYNINMRLIKRGWNPNLPFNERSFVAARTRLSNYIDTYYNPTIVDISRLHSVTETENIESSNSLYNTEAIYLVKIREGDAYIAFTPTFTSLYGKPEELVSGVSIDDTRYADIYMVYVDPKIKADILGKIIDNAWRSLNTDYFELFSDLDSDKITGVKFLEVLAKTSGGDIVAGAKVYKIYNGEWGHINIAHIEKLAQAIYNDPKIGKQLKVCTVGEAVDTLYKSPFIEYIKLIRCNESENEANVILEDLRFLLSPDVVITEAKPIPVRVNDKGVTIDLPSRIEEEYQTVHKALIAYDEAGNYDGMKDSLAHLWYLNLLCERKITKWKDKEKKQEQAKIKRDERARILNDFKKYLKKVIKADPSFDFTKYFEKSKWNDRSIFIDMETLKYTGKVIAAIAKSVLHK